MGATIIKTAHWTCDVKGCKEHGSGVDIPPGWRFVQVWEAGVLLMKALTCPTCFAGIEMRVSFLKHKKQEAA